MTNDEQQPTNQDKRDQWMELCRRHNVHPLAAIAAWREWPTLPDDAKLARLGVSK